MKEAMILMMLATGTSLMAQEGPKDQTQQLWTAESAFPEVADIPLIDQALVR